MYPHYFLLPTILVTLLQSQVARSDTLDRYEQSRLASLQPRQNCEQFTPQVGITVTARDASGHAKTGRIRVLAGAAKELALIAPFNDWGAKRTAADQLHKVGNSDYFEGYIRHLEHGMPYRLLLDGRSVLDPAAAMFSPVPGFLNSVFWDFDHPDAYHVVTTPAPTVGKALVIAEAEVYSLVQKWDYNGRRGPESSADTYRFIAESGVIDELVRAGYNAVELLPVSESVDGDNWAFHYQPYGLYATTSIYGNPDDFARMIDAFNQAGVAVILDSVLGHYPADGNIGVRRLAPIGLSQWHKQDGQSLFGAVPTSWGTRRWDFANPAVRTFLTDSAISMLCRFPFSGYRFDNVDGIHDYEGPGGGGLEFLHQLTGAIRTYRPQSLLIGESFTRDASIVGRIDQGGVGMGFVNHIALFDFFKENLQRPTETLDLAWLGSALHQPWSIDEGPRVAYLTNHDEAANRRGGATGAYVASLIAGRPYAQAHKTIAFASLALFSGAAYLDMPQLRLLQQGTFSSNSAIDWPMLVSAHPVYDFMAAASFLVNHDPAFAFATLNNNMINHLDQGDGKHLISFVRGTGGHQVVVLLNLGHQTLPNYRFGIRQSGSYRVIIDSDALRFGGSGLLTQRLGGTTLQTVNAEYFGSPASLSLPYVAPYQMVVLAKD